MIYFIEKFYKITVCHEQYDNFLVVLHRRYKFIMVRKFDFLVIGSGIAGMSFALKSGA